MLHRFEHNKHQILDLLASAGVGRLSLDYHGKKGGGEVDAFYFYSPSGELIPPPPEISGVDILVYRARTKDPVLWPIGLVVFEWVYDFLDFKIASWVWGSRGYVDFNVLKRCVLYYHSAKGAQPITGYF